MKELRMLIDADELMEWMAYRMLSDKDEKERLLVEIQKEKSQEEQAEDCAKQLRLMFCNMGAG